MTPETAALWTAGKSRYGAGDGGGDRKNGWTKGSGRKQMHFSIYFVYLRENFNK